MQLKDVQILKLGFYFNKHLSDHFYLERFDRFLVVALQTLPSLFTQLLVLIFFSFLSLSLSLCLYHLSIFATFYSHSIPDFISSFRLIFPFSLLLVCVCYMGLKNQKSWCSSSSSSIQQLASIFR